MDVQAELAVDVLRIALDPGPLAGSGSWRKRRLAGRFPADPERTQGLGVRDRRRFLGFTAAARLIFRGRHPVARLMLEEKAGRNLDRQRGNDQILGLRIGPQLFLEDRPNMLPPIPLSAGYLNSNDDAASRHEAGAGPAAPLPTNNSSWPRRGFGRSCPGSLRLSRVHWS